MLRGLSAAVLVLAACRSGPRPVVDPQRERADYASSLGEIVDRCSANARDPLTESYEGAGSSGGYEACIAAHLLAALGEAPLASNEIRCLVEPPFDPAYAVRETLAASSCRRVRVDWSARHELNVPSTDCDPRAFHAQLSWALKAHDRGEPRARRSGIEASLDELRVWIEVRDANRRAAFVVDADATDAVDPLCDLTTAP